MKRFSVKRHVGTFVPALFFSVLAVQFCFGQTAEPETSASGLKVTLTSARTSALPFQEIELMVTVKNDGSDPSPALARSALVGPKTVICAGPPREDMTRTGEWAIVDGIPPDGAIGPLLPGESFTLPHRVRIPESLASEKVPVAFQWVGRSAPFAKARSNELMVMLQDGNSPVATVDTSEGVIVFELWPDRAPNHVANFLELAEKGFFDGNLFHRVIRNFVIQTGAKDGTGDPGHTIAAEFHEAEFKKGVVGMARRPGENDSASSQWFVCVSDQPALNGQYTAFGRVIEGQDIADRISMVPTKDDRPLKDVTVRTVRIESPPTYVRPEVQKVQSGPSGNEGR